MSEAIFELFRFNLACELGRDPTESELETKLGHTDADEIQTLEANVSLYVN